MLFNSFQFIFFFIVVVFVYFSIPQKWRWMLLLAASYYFYMCWKVEYILLIVISTLVDFYAGIKIYQNQDNRKRRKYLILSLVVNLGILFLFKYYNFFNDTFRSAFNHYNIFYNIPSFDVLLPVGISFYTFQTLSYTIDVYRGKKEPERHLGYFATYVAFFPQLVAGPIERSTHLLPQFFEKHELNREDILIGLKKMVWGFFKKMVIADRLSLIVDPVYGSPVEYSGGILLLATFCFAIQIYCDFSGYTDIAIGTARILGFRLMENFKQPYLATNISEFWSRWHISLTSWFKDYLYYPLGGNRTSRGRWIFNVLVVFLLSGLWHGANWTFIVWAMLHVFYYYIYSLAGLMWSNVDNTSKMVKFFKWLITFNLVVFAWIFFRAENIIVALDIVYRIFTESTQWVFVEGFPINQLFYFVLMLLVVVWKSVLEKSAASVFHTQMFYACVLNLILYFSVNNYASFIYFQF